MGKPPHDKYRRINRRIEEKKERPPTKNQPAPIAYKIALKWLYPKDQTAHFFVNTDKRLGFENLQVVAQKFAELLGMQVWVYDSLLGFEVYLEEVIPWAQVEQVTEQVLLGG